MMTSRRFSTLLLICALAVAGGALVSLGTLHAAGAEGASSRLDPLLDHTTAVVGESLVQLSDVECKESVSQTKLGKNGKVEYEENSLFDYVVLFQSSSGEPIMVESRLSKEGPRHSRNVPLLITNGFSTLLLIFHPYYAGDYQFVDLGEEPLDGRACVKVHFQHIKGLRSTTALMLRGREYPLDLQGTAFIDKASGTIVRINASLESPMEDVGLRSLQTEVQYAPVKFQGASRAYWLPVSAVIDVESVHQHWRNLHRFTAYHRFETSVKENIGSVP
ncbi:MAG: hypothetical protein LAO04_09485 [Acidobacteriia bacterium]|nr:hypothetical protein [Terriglobia bacterium]